MARRSRSTIRHLPLFGLCLAVLLGAHWLATRSRLGAEISANLWGMNLRQYTKFLEELPKPERTLAERDLLQMGQSWGLRPPRLSRSSGIYLQPFRLEIEGIPSGAHIRYSTDGSVPTWSHPKLEGALSIQKDSVIRVKSFSRGDATSPAVTATYLVGHRPNVSIISLALDPVYLFNKHSGIYANPKKRGRAWERPVEFAIISPATGQMLEAEGKLRIHGNASRSAKRKSFRLWLPPEAGDLRAWLGPEGRYISRDQTWWILRHVGNPRALFRDRLGNRVARQLGLFSSPAIPCVLYLNGKVWGVYDLMERVNIEFLKGRMPGSKKFTLLRGSLSNPEAFRGDQNEWLELYAYLDTHDLSDPQAYREVVKNLDLENLIDYWILQIFSADHDRPDSNMDIFRSEDGDRLWKFLVWDLDGGFNYDGKYTDLDSLAWHLRDVPRRDLKPHGTPDSPGHVRSTLLFRKLMGNPDFRRTFSSRFRHALETVLSPENLGATFDQLLEEYRSVREIELERFEGRSREEAMYLYDQQIAHIRDFMTRRPGILKKHLDRYMNGG